MPKLVGFGEFAALSGEKLSRRILVWWSIGDSTTCGTLIKR